ncbi:hypothetical protein PUMCH_004035 [Australozyma saopauloensis]|uniref:Autophagy-related protein 6 n=1 Tax=Australozyma saopauloensis TaxID=291208 RepID=A0AAX4HDQ1_9ASCO|nr:hypothetical protein PUMCH_004035 [[Candida] saopauloensis]
MGYFCQNCLAPINLDDSLRNLSDQQRHLLVSRAAKAPPTPGLPAPKFIPKDRLERYNRALSLNPTEAELRDNTQGSHAENSYDSHRSFVYISDSEEAQEGNSANEHQEDENRETNGHAKAHAVENGSDQLPDFSKVKSLNQVFRILLTNQDVSHPMCKECAALLTENYKLKFDHSQREKEQYASFLKKLKDRSSAPTSSEAALDAKLSGAEAELQELRKLEEEKLQELELLEDKHSELMQQISQLDSKLEEINETELSELFKMKNTFTSNLQLELARLEQAKALYKKHLNQLDRLRSFNVYTRLFDILFDAGDGFGRINGCRLGYRVPWPELNVSLGHVARLVTFLKLRLDVQLDSYKIVSLGLKSYIVKYGHKTDESAEPAQQTELSLHSANEPASTTSSNRSGTVLPLYSSNEFTLGKLFNYNSIDVSMLALLDILSLFERDLVKRDEGLAFPYVISATKGTIGGRSIRLSSNSPWTEACRYLLTDLNWILSYVSAQPAPDT